MKKWNNDTGVKCCFWDRLNVGKNLNGFVRMISYKDARNGEAYEMFEGQLVNGRPLGFGRRIVTNRGRSYTYIGYFKDSDKTDKGPGIFIDKSKKYSGMYAEDSYYLYTRPEY